MAVSYTVDRGGSYVNAIAENFLTTEEICWYLSKIERDESIRKNFAELFDASRIAGSRVDRSGVERIVELARIGRKRSRDSKLAIVVSRGDSFERARYFEKLAADMQTVIVFNSISTAEKWLGVG